MPDLLTRETALERVFEHSRKARRTLDDHATMLLLAQAEAPESAIAFSCIGRWLKTRFEAFTKGKSPCNYAGGGLFQSFDHRNQEAR